MNIPCLKFPIGGLKCALILFAFLLTCLCGGCVKKNDYNPASPKYHQDGFNIKTSSSYHGATANYHNPECFACHPSTEGSLAMTTCVVCHGPSKARNCSQCHPAEVLSDASHPSHSGEMDCDGCHPGYRLSDSTIAPDSHLDGSLDISLSATMLCTRCHKTLTDSAKIFWASGLEWPRFSSANGCNACHGFSPSRFKDAHAAHLDTGGTAIAQCDRCHGGYNRADSTYASPPHMNDTIDVRTPLYGGVFSSRDSTCANTYCHGNFPGGDKRTVAWSGPGMKCGDCHGLPPNTGAHRSHADSAKFDCKVCHDGNSAVAGVTSAAHMDSLITVAFSDDTLRYPTLNTARYTAGTCNQVTCHGYGRSNTEGIVWASGSNLAWAAGNKGCNDCHNTAGHKVTETVSMKIPCYGCHDVKFHLDARDTTMACGACHALPPKTGGHVFHSDTLKKACNLCHLGYTLTTVPAATHINGINTVNGPLSGGAFSPANRTCANVYCHGNFPGGKNATVSWTATAVACNSCHTLTPATARHGSHTGPGKYECSVCHNGYRAADSTIVRATHADSIKQVNGALDGGTYAPASKSCSNVYCHGNFPGGKNPTLSWTGPLAGCNLCHNLPPATGGHAKHSASAKYDCKVCHLGYSLKDSSTSAVRHINHVKDVDGNLYGGTFARIDTSCSNSYCHGNFIGGKNTKARWNSGPLACNTCHNVPATTASHAKHGNAATYNYDCSVCHTGNSARTSTANPLTHADSLVTVAFRTAYIDSLFGAGKGAAMTVTNHNCNNVACHGYGFRDTLGVVWNRAAVPWSGTLGCTGCHNATGHNGGTGCQDCHAVTTADGSTIADYTRHVNGKVEGGAACGSCHALPPATGAHLYHSGTLGKDCNVCHAGISRLDTTPSPATHNNGRNDVSGLPGGGTYTAATKTCSNVYCHGNFPGGNNSSIAWTAAKPACNACHNLPPSTGSHAGHTNAARKVYDCGTCHNGYSKTGSTVSATRHANQIFDVDGTASGTWSGSANTCASTYCHGNFTGGARATATWGGTAPCGSCHTMTVMTNEHRRHREHGVGCEHCHSGYYGGTTANWTTHLNNRIDVGPFVDDSNRVDADAVYSAGSCLNLNCHARHVW